MKNLKKVLALVLAVVMILGTIATASAVTYTDVKADDTYAEAIDILSNLKILDGFKVSDDKYEFRADGTLTRAQAAKIVAIVHNAATNGKIQSDIADLYANAQNPFVDCNGNWALPYINYCRITGLADGMTTTTYAPKREVTGVQFLKLMLTTLGFDTSKEGYTGTGWDINVLNRANEIGLTAGLADGWKAIAPVKRGEAAQILVNALTAYLVEYGTKIKAPTNIEYSPLAQTKAQAAYNETFDAFKEKNPKTGKSDWDKAYGEAWNSVKDSKKMTADEKLEYAENVADEAQFAAAKKAYDEVYAKFGLTGVFDIAFVSGESVNKTGMTLASKIGITVKADHDKFMRPGTTWKYKSWSKFYMDTAKATYNTAVSRCDILKAFGVAESDPTAIPVNVYTDGVKGIDGEDPSTSIKHDTVARTCQKTDPLGCQGVLTQLWKVGTEYRITEIHYFLAKVTDTNKADHQNAATSNLEVYTTDPVTAHNHWDSETLTYAKVDNTDYAKDTYVVVTISRIDNNVGAEDSYAKTDDAQIVDIEKAEMKTGKLTGSAAINHDPSTTKIDGTTYNDACQFALGYGLTKDSRVNNGKTFDFFMDSFGNVIGAKPHEDAATYVVIDKLWKANAEATGDLLNAAVLVDFDAKTGDKVFVSALTDNEDAYDELGLNFELYSAAKVNSYWNHEIFSYTTDKDGKYVLTYTAPWHADGFVSYQKGFAVIHVDGAADVKINNETKFLVKDAKGEYKAYTGSALPALTGASIDAVMDTDGFYATYVYITGAAYEGDTVTGFVIDNGAWDNEWTDVTTGRNYELKTVYVNGEAVTVRLSMSDRDEGAINGTGFYTFRTEVDDNGVVIYKVSHSDTETIDDSDLETVLKDADKGVLNTDDSSNFLVDETTPVYLVDIDGLTVGSLKNVTEGAKVYLDIDTDKYVEKLKAIYVMLDGHVPEV